MSRTPQYQPIRMLPTLAIHIDGMLLDDNTQYLSLQQARSKPHILDDHTVSEVIRVFGDAKNDLPLFDEQLRRWSAEKLTTEQRLEVARLKNQMIQLHTVIDAILKLADELSQGTIEKQLAKSDEQLGLEALMQMFGGEQ